MAATAARGATVQVRTGVVTLSLIAPIDIVKTR
jgi:hypothetical protein